MAHAKNGCRNRAMIWKVQPDPSEVERSVVARQPVLWSQRTFSASEKRQRNDRTRCEPNSGAIRKEIFVITFRISWPGQPQTITPYSVAPQRLV